MSSKALATAFRKAKTRKGKRILESREAQVHEPAKRLLLMKGNKTSDLVLQFLADMHDLHKPNSVYLSSRRQNDLHPFDDPSSIEYLCQKNECGLFCFGSSSKKRPFRIVVGRTFDKSILDMVEFAVTDFTPMKGYKVVPPALGGKPLVIFQGAAFESSPMMRNLQSLLGDFLRGPKPSQLLLQGIEHVIIVSAPERAMDGGASSVFGDMAAGSSETLSGQKLVLSQHRVSFKKSGTKLPRVELEEMGPSLTITVDRHRMADSDRMKAALMLPRELKPKKEKNVTTNVLGEKRGRVHLGVQQFEKIYTPHSKFVSGAEKRQKTRHGKDQAEA
uniref:Ribosome production factor 2 homolog n=1 Tax=Chromera velia CCMP2878 TaxID=1169474 RepID=A0A0G4HKL3_9ALVE|eukprot:Cvel_28533.t1-p1 / transcript=Cvel_28533.t1 / gene=Cvel_28533 / organism=Chromera_velia_CCMP2878 / gene_product=Ribosome production factor 2 homolog, putative / transcript_product=Ribosome production factor 2 homolog, putative / location=Cvel_scaffold3756:8076-12058(-) / protein_length=331 / sequence_SO=supercontig / SO=protein_coding / is_pseudo=false